MEDRCPTCHTRYDTCMCSEPTVEATPPEPNKGPENPQCPLCTGKLIYTQRVGLIEGGPMVLMLGCSRCEYQFPKQLERTWQEERASVEPVGRQMRVALSRLRAALNDGWWSNDKEKAAFRAKAYAEAFDAMLAWDRYEGEGLRPRPPTSGGR